MHNIVSGCKDIALHILFLVLFGNSKCFPVYGAFRYLYGPGGGGSRFGGGGVRVGGVRVDVNEELKFL